MPSIIMYHCSFSLAERMTAVEGVLALMIGGLMSVMVVVFKYMSSKNFLLLWSFYSFLNVH